MVYARPEQSDYGKTAIVCLAEDLNVAATSRAVKRDLAGDGENTLLLFGMAQDLSQFFGTSISGKPRDRLIIVAHGDRRSTCLASGTASTATRWNAEQLARQVHGWLGGYSISRISLDACYSGGYRGPNAVDESADEFNSWQVGPYASFAWKFASYLGLAGDVTARTDYGTTHFLVGDRTDFAAGDRPSYNTVAGRYKELWDKIIITPAALARPNNKLDPSRIIRTKGRLGGRATPQPLQ